MLDNKKNMIDYIMKHNQDIKEIDTAIPLDVIKHLNIYDINSTFLISVYFTNGNFKIINILELLLTTYKKREDKNAV
jgi:hypothetical protein